MSYTMGSLSAVSHNDCHQQTITHKPFTSHSPAIHQSFTCQKQVIHSHSPVTRQPLIRFFSPSIRTTCVSRRSASPQQHRRQCSKYVRVVFSFIFFSSFPPFSSFSSLSSFIFFSFFSSFIPFSSLIFCGSIFGLFKVFVAAALGGRNQT